MSDKTSVFHLITRFNNGGAEQTTWNELRALKKTDKYALSLGFGPQHDPRRVEEVTQNHISTRTFKFLRHYNLPALVLAVLEVAVFLWRNDIEILHTHSTEAGIVGRLAGTVAGVPVVVHEIHGDPISSDRNSLLNQFILRLERWCAPLTTAFIAKSERIRDQYLDRGIGRPEQFELIYHGVDLDRYDSNQTPSQMPDTEGPIITFVGRLEPGKGLIDLLSAFETVRESEPATLFIVGDGTLTKRLAVEISDRGLDRSVHLLGHRNDIPELLNVTDVFVLPSYREGTPRVITEARAAELPVISTEIAGIPEQVEDGTSGYLVSPGDVSALAARLKELVQSDSLRERFGSNAATGLDAFDRHSVAEELRALYSSLCDRELAK